MRRENTQNTFKWYWRPLRSTGNFKKLILETEGTNTGENGGKGEWTEETHTLAKAQRQTTKDSNVK